jgi:hypothetical protein
VVSGLAAASPSRRGYAHATDERGQTRSGNLCSLKTERARFPAPSPEVEVARAYAQAIEVNVPLGPTLLHVAPLTVLWRQYESASGGVAVPIVAAKPAS